MAAIGWLIRLLVLAVIVRMVLRAVMGKGIRPKPRQRQVAREGGTLERDPECGTFVPRSAAVIARDGGRTLYFCSSNCRDAHLSTQARAV